MQRSSLSSRIALLLLLQLTVGCETRARPRSALSLLARGEGAGRSLRGRVIERVDAGPYRYLRLSHERGEQWLVSLTTNAQPGSVVTATVLADVRDFESRRLRRTFDRLAFATVREEATTENRQ